MKRSTTLFPLSKQRLHKSQFLQKLSCQKPYWDQARFSSLINKQVAFTVMTHCDRFGQAKYGLFYFRLTKYILIVTFLIIVGKQVPRVER